MGPGGGGGLGFEEGAPVGWDDGEEAGDFLEPQARGSMGAAPRNPRQCTTVSALFLYWLCHFAARVRKPALVEKEVVVAVVAVATTSSKRQTMCGIIVHVK